MTEEVLCRFERKILRRIYGPVQVKGCWHPRWNSGIYVKIVILWRILKLEGHIIRMEDERF